MSYVCQIEKIEMGNSISIHLSQELFEQWGYTAELPTSGEIRREIYLPKKKIISIEPGIFSRFGQLTILDLSHNGITGIHARTFKGLKKLELLQLNSNKIHYLDKECFSGLSDLKNLNLANNCIRTIDTMLFRGLINLEDLNLSSNKIESISELSFQNLSKLKRLYLGYNCITTILNKTFFGLISLEELELRSNWINFVSAISIKDCNPLHCTLTKKLLEEIFYSNPICWNNLRLEKNGDINFDI